MKPKPPRARRLRLTLLVFLAGLVLILHHGWRTMRRSLTVQESRMRVEATRTGADLSGMSQHLLRKKLPASVDLLMGYASMAPDLDLGVVLGPGETIQHATRRQWVGVALDSSPLAHSDPLANEARARMEARIEIDRTNGSLIAAFPFWSKPDGKSKGVVLLGYSLSRTKAVAWHATLHESVSQVFSLAAGCLLFWLMVSQQLDMRRLLLVLAHARTLVLREGPETAADPDGDLASLTRSFSDAAERFDETEQQLSRLASGIRDVFWYVRVDKPGRPFVNAAYGETWESESASDLEVRRWAWLRRISPEDRRKALRWIVELISTGQAPPIELRLRFPDTRSKWIECRGFSVAGMTTGMGLRAIGGLVTDVTERKILDRRLLEAAEEERMRIGQDLHDDVCQRMAAAMLKGGVLQNSLARSGLPEARLAAEVSHDLSEATEIVRGFAQGLAPVVIEAEGLETALTQLAAFIERVFGVPCHSACGELPGDLSKAAATHLYRIAQELASNAARHARPSQITIAIKFAPDSPALTMRVSNDGIPFNGKPLASSSGMGLHAVRKHVEALGGRIDFTPSNHALGGTVVTCHVPLPAL